jgi:hypothetical protein
MSENFVRQGDPLEASDGYAVGLAVNPDRVVSVIRLREFLACRPS